MSIPVFKSHYSLGRSILTLSNENNEDKIAPDSIIDICKKNKLKEFFLAEDSMGGFLEAYQNSKENKLQLIYGLRLTICADMLTKNEESLSSNCKYIIFIKNTQGYKDLIKINDLAAKEGFYYEPRIDFQHLQSFWTKNLMLCVPFYDSFIFKNILEGKTCIPEFEFIDDVSFFIEDNNLPFDDLLKKGVLEFTNDGNDYPVISSQSIYYNNREDFKAYLTFNFLIFKNY